MVLGNVEFTTFDVGGHVQSIKNNRFYFNNSNCRLIFLVRRTWQQYFFVVDAIVFIIDVSKAERFAEAKSELAVILESEEISKCPIVILGNKIDKDGAINEQELKDVLGLDELTTGKVS